MQPRWVIGILLGAIVSSPHYPAFSRDASPLLTEANVSAQLQQIPGWMRDGDALVCRYTFADFKEAIAFVTQLVDPADALGHHPDMAISYNRVDFYLTTHDAGGLTQLDLDLARQIAARAQAASPPHSCLPVN
ncbi:MAG: 4a-hydroxytetrahydrobiopterin dehydratase [Kaiparowitsia implicata GSE-PSE-MK54-09C]|jgi:4a-hydroxytetrahydrobiopterin dehydratase|nr:4a-hydroxytetrahydrobiopterin dehydratase [Kaiparowitsia implicata GSE-PSE-MK54-09C]